VCLQSVQGCRHGGASGCESGLADLFLNLGNNDRACEVPARNRRRFMLKYIAAACAALALAACGDREGSVGEFSNDFLGNEIMVEAFTDPEIPGVVCHVSYFDRSALDRLRQGNWFENPSNSAVACQR